MRHIFLMRCSNTNAVSYNTVLRFTGIFFSHLIKHAIEVPSSNATISNLKTALNGFFGRLELDALLQIHPEVQRSRDQDYADSYTRVFTEVFALHAGGNPKLPDRLREQDASRDKLSIVLNTLANGLVFDRSQMPLNEHRSTFPR